MNLNLDELIIKDPKEIQRIVENYLIKIRDEVAPNTIPTLYYQSVSKVYQFVSIA